MNSLLRRIAAALSLLIGVFVLCFVLFQLLPTDPVRAALGPYASADAVKGVRHSLGLDLPPGERFLRGASNLLKGDWGTSIIDGRSVSGLVWQRFLITFKIGLSASLMAAVISLALNGAATRWPLAGLMIQWGKRLSYLPAFIFAFSVALLLALLFPGLSLSSDHSTEGLAIVLASLHPAALLAALLAERFEQEQKSHHWKAARALGHGGFLLLYRSLFRPVAVSWLAAVVNQLSGIIFTVLLIEVTFSLPGLGTLFVAATQRADLPVLQGIILANALLFIGLAILAEIAYNRLDPRVR
jgi:peptide/nickel transport system permease protein